jgi:hypothetical protein
MHGKGPIYVELHCTVMARLHRYCSRRYFLSLKTYFITIKNIVSEEEMKIIGESPVFLNYLSSVYCVALLANKKTKKTMRILVRKPCISLLVFLLRQLFIFKKPRKPAILVRKPC